MRIPIKEVRDIERAKDLLTAIDKYNGSKVPMYDDSSQGWFGVPLYHFGISNLSLLSEEVIDNRAFGTPITTEFTSDYWPGQAEVLRRFEQGVKAGRTGFILKAPPGFGKCHGKGTEVLMYNGTLKKVEDIVVGDLLMGPDSLPRRVCSLGRGRAPMFRICPNKGESFTCNAEHVLSLQLSPFFQRNGNRKGGRIRGGEIVNISLNEYLKKSNNFKNSYGLWRAAVDFPSRTVPYDPYFVGVYLGDGTKKDCPCVTLGESKSEIVDYVRQWARENLVDIREEQGNNCIMYHLTQPGRRDLVTGRGYNFVRRDVLPYLAPNGIRRIPSEYIVNSEEVRLNVLAGLLDTDGSLVYGTVYDLTTKYAKLAVDIAFMSRSLGFACNVSPCQKGCNDFVGTYYRLTISGDTDRIPCKVCRKRARPRRQVKSVLRSGFTVDSLGDGEYFGFELDGDGLYLLRDFTVTHNTVCLIKMLADLGRTALVVVPRSNLVKQWVSRLLEHTSLKRRDIGVVVSGKASWEGKKVVVGLVHSLALDRYGEDFKKAFGVIVFDEVDRSVPPTTFAPVVTMFPAKYRIGASAVTKRQDGMEVVFKKHVGQMILKGADKNRMKPGVYMHEFAGDSGFVYPGSPKLNRRGMLLSKLSKNVARNLLIVRYIKALYTSGRRVLILSDRTAQLIQLRLMCSKKYEIPLSEMGYYTRSLDLGGGKKKHIPVDYRQRVASDCKVIFATYGLCALGTDIPDLAGLVYATPQSNTTQSKGRIERLIEGKETPIIVDIVDSNYKDAVGWARNRERQYKAESLKIIKRRG